MRSFASVYADHRRRVYTFLARRVSEWHHAEDLTQATFERAFRAWGSFDPERASETTWLLTIARNLLIDHQRRQHVRRSEPISERQLPAVEGPERRFDHYSPALSHALGELGRRDREVLALRFRGDLTGPEIAQVLDLSVSNVQQITSRSLRKLRERLAPRDHWGGLAAVALSP